MQKVDEFTAAYIKAMLWSTPDDRYEPATGNRDKDDARVHPDIGENLDDNFDGKPGEFEEESWQKILADCKKFQKDNWDDIQGELSQAGHDFWLTRQGHGAGFWDGDWTEEAGQRLTKAAEVFGQCYLYVGDDGKIYFYGGITMHRNWPDQIRTGDQVYAWFRTLFFKDRVNFHPDDEGATYIDKDCKPTFTEEEAAAFDRLMRQAFEVVGDEVYTLGGRAFGEYFASQKAQVQPEEKYQGRVETRVPLEIAWEWMFNRGWLPLCFCGATIHWTRGHRRVIFHVGNDLGEPIERWNDPEVFENVRRFVTAHYYLTEGEARHLLTGRKKE